MTVQGSDTAALANASAEMIKEAIFTIEHSTPNKELVRNWTLEEGHDTAIIPKVGQMTMMVIPEAEKNTNEMDIGMTTTSVVTSIVGGKVVLTDTVVRNNKLDLWQIAGEQVGEAAVRRYERDIIALYTGLNGGTSLGAASAIFNSENVMNVIATAMTNKYGMKLHVIHHPNCIMRLAKDLTTVGTGGSNRPLPRGYSQDRLQDFFSNIVLGTVPFFQTGNIDRDANNDAIGVIKQKDAIGVLQAGSIRRKKVRDESIGEGVWVLYVTHRYAAFEMDDAKGAPLTYAAATPATS